MNDDAAEMIDVVYDLKGGSLPGEYVAVLWQELVRALPWLDAEELAGMLPLRGSQSDTAMLLPQRAKLVLRLPQRLQQQAQQLSGQTLDVGGHALQVGAARQRLLQAYPTLHAHLVASAEGEEEFLAAVSARLSELDIPCKWICGKRVELRGGEGTIPGYSLVVHDLKPEGSLRLQQMGLGGERRYGCGLFVPYKEIAGLD
ncbi:MAG: type I-MYXAN CRISPR-associated protein Cas6/Cmx6 [Sideroxydans sp.]|nr:type I-MYXAN CRISPR-associated protein Cas6/Cmx6 [Sideroxydans sp.]